MNRVTDTLEPDDNWIHIDSILRSILDNYRICPDSIYYGHLSGCSYSEGMSWRKMDARGQFSEIHADATLILPFLVKFVMENE